MLLPTTELRTFTDNRCTVQLLQEGPASNVSSSNRVPTSAAAQEKLEDTVLHSTNQFYKWHSELEAAFASETEEKYKQYAAELQGRLDTCADILGKVMPHANVCLAMQMSLRHACSCYHIVPFWYICLAVTVRL